MSDFNNLDYIIIAIIAIFTIKGLVKGIINEGLGLLGLLVSLVVATKYVSNFANFLRDYLNVAPAFITLLAFMVIFVGCQIGFQLINFLLHRIVKYSFTTWLEKVAGGLIGLYKGLLVASLLVLLISILPFSEQAIPQQKDSKLMKPLKKIAPSVFNVIMFAIPGSKSFYGEMKESFDNFSLRSLGKDTEGFLQSLQPPEDEPTKRSQSQK